MLYCPHILGRLQHCLVQLSVLTNNLDTHNGKWRSDADFVLVFTCNSRTWLTQRVLWVAHSDNNEQTHTYRLLEWLYSGRWLLSVWAVEVLVVQFLFHSNLSTLRRTWFIRLWRKTLEWDDTGISFCWSEHDLKTEITYRCDWYFSSHFSRIRCLKTPTC